MRTVITYGTFDLFHRGHYNILKRAKEEGDYLIVAVTGETYDMERGKLSVQDSLATRIENVRKTGFADKIIVEEYLGQKISDILRYHVDVLVVGSDWKGKFDHMSKYCEVKYLERTKNISSTQIREETFNIQRFGIVTDDLYDSEFLIEAQSVSGIHVESVFSPDEEIVDRFVEMYELNSGTTDYEEFLNNVEIVYVKSARDSRYDYVKQAIEAGKHVISDMPVTMDMERQRELEKQAVDKGVLFFGNVLTLYQYAFSQLLWMARGNIIGDIINVRCSISKEDFDEKSEFDVIDLSYYPVCTILKILGTDYESCRSKFVKNEDGEISYGAIFFEYENATAIAEIGMKVDLNNDMIITGTNGEIVVPDDWWRMGYFKYKNNEERRQKHYSSNFDGNGLRYLLQTILHDIREGNGDSNRITEKESEAAELILKDISDKLS